MIKFYSVILTRLGMEYETIVIGTYQQANDYTIKEASANGCTYDVRMVASHEFNGVKNITND